MYLCIYEFTFSNLADAFIQSDLQIRTMEAIKINKRAMICKCYIKSQLKGGITHTVSPNLMLILSTYRVVLHPSYLQKVFSFIIFIKERYSFTIFSEKKPSSWRRAVWAELKSEGVSWAELNSEGVSWAELKSDEHLSADHQQNTDI